MAENVGTAYAEISADLTKLRKDITQARALFAELKTSADKVPTSLDGSFKTTGAKISKGLTTISNSAISQFARMAKGITASIMGIPIIGWIAAAGAAIAALAGKIVKMAESTAKANREMQQQYDRLTMYIENTGAAAWTTTKMMQAQAQELSTWSGETVKNVVRMQQEMLKFRNITGQVFQESQKHIINMAAALDMDLTQAANTVGYALNNPARGLQLLARQGVIFNEEQRKIIMNLMETGRVAEAQSMIMGRLGETYKGASAAMSAAVTNQQRLELAQERYNVTVGESTRGFSNWWAGVRAFFYETAAGTRELENQIETIKRNRQAFLDRNLALQQQLVTSYSIADANDKALEQDRIRLRQLEQAQTQHQHNLLAVVAYNKAIESGGESAIRAARQNLEIITGRVIPANQLNARVIVNGIEQASKAELEKVEQNIKNQQKIGEENARRVAREEESEAAFRKLEEDKMAIVLRRQQAEDAAQKLKDAGLITELQRQQDIVTARENEARSLLTLRDAIAATTVESAEAKRMQAALAAATVAGIEAAVEKAQEYKTTIEETKAEEAMIQKIRDLNFQYLRLTNTGADLKKIERERAWEAITSQKEYQALVKSGSEEHLAMLEEIERKFNAIWDHEPVKEYEDKVKRTLQQVLKQYDQHIGEVNSIIQSGLQFWAAGERRKTQQLQRELRERYNMDIQYWNDRLDLQRQQLDRELQHRLYMMGFVDAATEEQHQRELELAIESGDQQRIFLAHSNFEKFKIEEEFAQKKANMELEMATEKEAMDLAFRQKEAELNYRAAMAEWKSALIMGAVNTALGITKAFPNKFLMGLIAGAGKTQMLVMSQNKPIQTFSNGGIVGGNSFRGDNILTRQNSGEIDINKRQQKKLWDFIEGGSEGNAQRPLHLTINLNSRVLTKEVVADINDRHELIFDTSVVRR